MIAVNVIVFLTLMPLSGQPADPLDPIALEYLDALPGRNFRREAAGVVHRAHHRNSSILADAHVVFAKAGREVDHARSLFGVDEVATQDAKRALGFFEEGEERLVPTPDQVAACVEAMRAAVDLPITVKHRIGVDDMDAYEDMLRFVDVVTGAGCT